jgi:ATP adenylyltransferase
LQPIATQTEVIDGFVVRAASTVAAKAAAPQRADPLGDYEPDLFVADVGARHYALLNKYPVMPDHLLVVTRRNAPQEELLDADDFAALGVLMAELDWLAFYNAGREAGASQARKHLQLVPAGVPLEALITGGALPFRHAYAALPSLDAMHRVYRDLIGPWPAGPYNLLATRRWMLVVPRRRERYETISVNALGFAGSLYVRNSSELEAVRHAGPMNVLRAVTLE